MATPSNPSLIKVFCFIPRRHDFTEQEFHDYWRHPHGTMAKRITTVRRYIQSHKTPLRTGTPEAPHDGAAELWFDDIDTANRLNEDPDYADYCGLDEPKFMDLGPDTFRVLTREVSVIKGGLGSAERGVKFLHLVRSTGDTTDAKLLRHLTSAKQKSLAEKLGAMSLTVCPALPETYVDELPPMATVHHWLTLDPYNAIREFWWPDTEAYQNALASPLWDELLAAEGVDTDRSPAFAADENVVVW
ncbi:EthD domain-containing protein [Streptomyces shenzhenensis]|uniref:EthD domain-containing protein n=1 Tax=Streptomyces shenzhenensis TaxID=943815 RepID=UPI00381D98A5